MDNEVIAGLILQVKDGRPRAYETLERAVWPMLAGEANKWTIPGYEVEDCRQVARIALYSAAQSFDRSRQISATWWLRSSIRRRLCDAARASCIEQKQDGRRQLRPRPLDDALPLVPDSPLSAEGAADPQDVEQEVTEMIWRDLMTDVAAGIRPWARELLRVRLDGGMLSDLAPVAGVTKQRVFELMIKIRVAVAERWIAEYSEAGLPIPGWLRRQLDLAITANATLRATRQRAQRRWRARQRDADGPPQPHPKPNVPLLQQNQDQHRDPLPSLDEDDPRIYSLPGTPMSDRPPREG